MMEKELPENWEMTTFENVSSYVQRGKSPVYAEKSDLPVINQKCIRWNKVELEHLKFIDPSQWPKLSAERFLQINDILWNSTGTGTIGRATLYKGLFGYSKAVADSHVTIIRVPQQCIVPQFVFYYVMSPYVQKKIEDMQTGSTNQVELGREVIINIPIPLAPLNEQKRIVSKVEELFSDLDGAEAALKKAQRLIEKYRQSVLKAAVTGELTKDWRAKNKNKLEPANKLLERILKERRENWKGKGQYKEPEMPDTSDFIELPEGWCWASLGQLSNFITSGSRGWAEYYAEKGSLFFRSQNVTKKGLSLNDIAYVCPPNNSEGERTKLQKYDLLVSITGDPGNIARITNLDSDAYISQHVGLVRLVQLELAEFIENIVRAPDIQKYFERVRYGATKPGLNLTQLAECPIVLPSIEEQKEICSRLVNAFLKIEIFDSNCLSEKRRIQSLRQSILKSAFSGKLVAQDSNDEPASELLKRIQIEREQNQPLKKIKTPKFSSKKWKKVANG